MFVAGIGTRIIVDGRLCRICKILNTHVEAEIIEGAQIGRIQVISFEKVEEAAGL
jgi:hypothetical protein